MLEIALNPNNYSLEGLWKYCQRHYIRNQGLLLIAAIAVIYVIGFSSNSS